MYKRDFDKLLQGYIPQAVFLYGESEFLIDFYGNKIKNQMIRDDGEVFSFYFEEYNANMIREILAEQSLFAQKSIVVLKLNKIKDYNKKPKDTEIGGFLEILKKNPLNNLIIEFYNNESSTYSKASKAISWLFNSKDFVAVRFFNPNKAESLEILRKFANDLKLNISDLTLHYLYDLQNKELGICVNELKKFEIFDGEITKEQISKLSYGLYANSIEELCEAMLNKNDCLSIIAKIEEEGIQDDYLISSIQAYFYRLFLFFAYIKSYGVVNCKEILGYALPLQLEEKYTSFAIRLREAHYLRIFAILNEWHIKNRSGKDKNSFANLIKLQAILK